MTASTPRVLLTILDGFGVAPATQDNAIAQANTPTLDFLFDQFPHTQLHTSGAHVGLPDGQMGNSEVGHMTIGSGRVLLQDFPRINDAIKRGVLSDHPLLLELISTLKQTHGTCHVMGLMSEGGVHSHQDHMIYLARLLAGQGIKVVVHGFLDGRDCPPQSGKDFIQTFIEKTKACATIQLASLSGRYFAMDRDTRWDRVQKAYDAIVSGKGKQFSSISDALDAAYEEGLSDEFISPMVAEKYEGIRDGDACIMCNFRADRVRELLEALFLESFKGFTREKHPSFSVSLGMVSYAEQLDAYLPALFSTDVPECTLGEIISSHQLHQLRIAETEKYAHVTFFFNGGRETPFEGEARILIPSPDVPTYDLKPEMSAFELTDALIKHMDEHTPELIICNYANPDMVGHTGKFEPTKQAIEAIDACFKQLFEAVKAHGYDWMITADHGNAEQMMDEHRKPFTSHTLNPVPFVLVSATTHTLASSGTLADIAPTILKLLGIHIPEMMTGKALV